MTFIASVVAKKGVAIIADSLVTSELPILHYQKFLEYLNAQPKNDQNETIVDPNGLQELFEYEPIYTKDYQEKLFRLNEYTAITTTGAAYINDKNISDLIEEFRGVQQDLEDLAIALEAKIEQFRSFLTGQIKEHLAKHQSIGRTLFVITYYEKHTHNTHIHHVTIVEATDEVLGKEDYSFVTLYKEQQWVKAVCHGQNKISDKILYGFGREFYGMFQTVIGKIGDYLEVPQEKITPDLIDKIRKDPYFHEVFYGDVELLNLTNLSVQQAVNLASLLMRIEVDFQKYTKDVPTVGGVIKLAVIDEKGFRFISGDVIEAPKHINI